jgi:acyl-CoA synthetase (AMP-forming)/AMP-acid ligase II
VGQATVRPTLGDLLAEAARREPGRAALVLPDQSRSYAELWDGAQRVARGLSALGVGRGDHVGLLMPNSAELVESLFGIALLGAVVVPLNTRLKRELGFVIRKADLVAVLTSDAVVDYVDFTEVLQTALPSLAAAGDTALEVEEAPLLRDIVLIRGDARPGFHGAAEFARLADESAAPAPAAVDPGDTGAILFTSGTTAEPKGCVLSHRALTARPLWRLGDRIAAGGRPVVWSVGPLFHIASLQLLIGSIGAAGTYTTDYHFDPGRAIEAISRDGATTIWPWFPAVIEALLEHPTYRTEALATVTSIGLVGPPELLRRVQLLLPRAELLTSCGMTETGGTYALSGATDSVEERAVTMGVPEPGIEVKVIDLETGAAAEPGQTGEILVRGDTVMDGYYKLDRADAGDGWIHTGDLYTETANGHLIFNGRLKDMLKVGGENVAAVEVEALLCEHPAVKIAEVVGSPHPRLDEVPFAFVELNPGAELAQGELIEFCRGRVASFKVPRGVRVVTAEEWPMSATKVDKRVLRDWATEAAAAAAG